jgi:hypothetical protein
VQKVVQNDSLVLESPSTSFVCLNGNLFEYEIVSVEHKEFGADGQILSNVISYDTVALYLWKPMEGTYFKVSSNGNKTQLVESGRLDQKNFGISFQYNPAKPKGVTDPLAMRDTLIEGIKLKLYEEENLKPNDTLIVRYYFFRNLPISSPITYVTAKMFTEEKDIFRVEIRSKQERYTYTVSVDSLKTLPETEARKFRKILVR